LAQISGAVEQKFVIEDVHNFGPYYDLTLQEWYKNVNAAWGELPQYDERFKRMWNYYLLSSEAGFRAGHIHLLQVVFQRIGQRPVYEAVR
jgi:cyclopropane-fatty-acyl-phospholipid synthase